MTSSGSDRSIVYIGLFMVATMLWSPLTIPADAFGIPEFLEFGECANTTNKPELDLERFSGVWFTREIVPNEYSDIVSCSMTNYTYKGHMVKMVERGLTTENRKIRQNSVLRYSEGDTIIEAEGVPSAPFHIVATDYDNYACAHSCMSFMGFRAAFSWIYTRNPEADHMYVVLCRDIFAEQGVDPTPLKPMEQRKDCPYVDKLPRIIAYNEDLKQKVAARAEEEALLAEMTPKPSKETISTKKPITIKKPITTKTQSTIPEHAQVEEETQKRLQEEEKKLMKEMEEERQRDIEERKRMEEERVRMEDERTRMEMEVMMEQEEQRQMEEERHRMEEERLNMEETRKTLEDERQMMEDETRRNEEELRRLRQDVRSEKRRNNRGKKHQTDLAAEKEGNASSLVSTSLVTLFISITLGSLLAL